MASEKRIDDILCKMESTSAKVELYKTSKVKLPMAELDYLKTLEDARDFMTMMVTKTSENRQQLADIFGGDCSRIARIRTVLDEVVLSDMNCQDQRVRTCTEACETIEKVLEDMGLGWCLKKAQSEEKASFTKRRSSIDREDLLKAVQQIEGQEASAVEVNEDALSPKAKSEAAAWSQCYDKDFVQRVLACQEPVELQALEQEAVASKTTKLGNWMIWMVHRAHLDDPTLVKFDFTNLKMPDGNVEPLISPKLAVAMESNTHIENLLMGCTNLRDQEAAILAVSLRSNQSLKVLNIDTNAIQPLTLESIANGTSVNQALQELRCNNTASGRLVTEAFLHALKSNPSLCKLGYPVTDAYFRGEIDKQLTRNNDAARKRRLEEKRRREAEGGAEKSETPKVQAKTQSAGYPAAKPTPPAATPKPAEAEPSVQSAVAEGEEKAEAKLEDEKPGAREAQEAQELQKGQEAQEAQEAKKAKEDQEAQEAKKAKEEQEAQEAKKAKEEQEAQEAKKAKEEQEAQEAKKAKEEQEAQEAKKAKEEQEAQEAKKAKEEQEAQEAKKAKEEQEAQEAKKAKEEQEAREAKKAKEEQEAQEAKKAKEEQEGTEAEEAQEAQPVTKAAPKTPVEPEDSAALPGMVEAPAPMRSLRGYLYKKSPSARLLKSWDWRYFVLHEGGNGIFLPKQS